MLVLVPTFHMADNHCLETKKNCIKELIGTVTKSEFTCYSFEVEVKCKNPNKPPL